MTEKGGQLTFGRRDVRRDFVDKVAIDANAVCEASLGDASTLVLESVVEDKRHLRTQLLLAGIALDTVATGIGKSARADEIADLVARFGSSGNHLADNLVACNDGSNGRVDHAAADDVDVRATASTVSDLDLDVLGPEGAWVVRPRLEGCRSSVGPAGEGGRWVFAKGVFRSRHGCCWLWKVREK